MNTSTTHTNPLNRVSQGYLICVFATAIWSTTAILIRYLTQTYQLPALVLAFWRDFFVVLTLFAGLVAISPKRLQVDREHLPFLVLYGLVLSVFNTLWTISVALNGAAVSTVLAYSSSAFTALLGWRLFNERLGPAKILAVSLSLAGCAFVSGAYQLSAWRLNALGILTGVLSGIGFAAYSLMGKESSNRKIDSWTALLYSFGFGAMFILAYNLAPGWLSPNLPMGSLWWLGGALAGWAVLLLLAMAPTLGGYGLYTLSLTYLPASVANLIATMEPAFTAFLAYFLLSERLSLPQFFGSILIVSGVVILRLSEGRRLGKRLKLA